MVFAQLYGKLDSMKFRRMLMIEVYKYDLNDALLVVLRGHCRKMRMINDDIFQIHY